MSELGVPVRRMKRALVQQGLAACALAACCAMGASIAACEVGDPICTDHTVEEDRNDGCPYGPPGGPQRTQASGCVVQFDDSDCTVTFRDDVFPILAAESNPKGRSGGGCTSAACHGPNGGGKADLAFPSDTPTADEVYNAMTAISDDAGNPYVAANNAKAWFLCNLKGIDGGGSAMPPTAGLSDSESTEDDGDMAVIEEWVRCGMKLDGTGTGSGGGGEGGGGVGGGNVGGAGGAGGGL